MGEAMEKEKPSAHALLWRSRDVLLAAPGWLDYMRRVYSVDPGGHPFLSYVGVNFTKETIKNYKFYFSFFRRLSTEEIDALLPVADRGRFDQLYQQWHPSTEYNAIHRGTTFALKVDADGTLTHYYHMRIRGLPFGPPERLTLSADEHDNYHGVCEEFTGSKIHLKRYYYCRNKTTIRESLDIAGLPDQSSRIDWLEYIESEGRDKMAWITGDRVLIDHLVDQRGQPRLASGLAKICHDCGFEMFGPGSARDRTDHSIYFIQPVGPVSGGGYLFDGVRRFATHHLKLARFPDQ
jgi:hypothetical protein